MVNKLYISNISEATTDKDLLELFSNSGEVISARVILDINNEKTRRGYVVMRNDEEAIKAITKNNNATLKGNKIKVMKAHPIDQDANYFSNQSRPRFYRKK